MKRTTTVLLGSSVAAALSPLLASAGDWSTILSFPPESGVYGTAVLVDPFTERSPHPRLFVGISVGNGIEEAPPPDGRLLILNRVTGDYRFASGITGTNRYLNGIKSLLYDPSDNSLYAAGGSPAYQVWKSLDQGNTWVMVDNVEPPGGWGFGAYSICADANQNVYSCGGAGTNAVVRKSSDHGAHWYTLNIPRAVPITFAYVPGSVLFVPGENGGLFVSENWSSLTAEAYHLWRSRDEGATWTNVLSGRARLSSLTCDTSGEIHIVTGGGPTVPGGSLRRSRDGGSSWQTLKTAVLEGKMAFDSLGTLFLIGEAYGWAVQQRSPDGLWSQPETPFGVMEGYIPSYARGISIDSSGNVFVTGSVRTPFTWTDSLAVQQLERALPALSFTRSGSSIAVSWSSALQGVMLEQANSPAGPWSPEPESPVFEGDNQVVNLPTEGPARYWRLRK